MRKQILIGSLLGALVLPSLVMAQSPVPAAGKCQAAVAPVSEALRKTSDDLSKLIDQISTIEDRVTTYYQSTVVPAGQALPSFAALDTEAQRTRQTAVVEVGQLSALQLRCTPNPAASVSRLSLEVGQAVGAVKAYRVAVRTELLAIRTRIQQAQPAPSASVEPTVPQ